MNPRRKSFRVQMFSNGWLYETKYFYTLLSAKKFAEKKVEEEKSLGAAANAITYDVWHEYFRGYQLWERIVASTNRAIL